MPFYMTPAAGEVDPGVRVKHPAFNEQEVLVLRSVLTDEILDDANEAASRVTGKGKDTAYKVALIAGMVLPDTVILNARTMLPVQMTRDGIKTLSPQVKNWMTNEITKLDGSVAANAEVTIAGETATFSEPTTTVGQGGGPDLPA